MSNTECKNAFVVPSENGNAEDSVKGAMQRLFKYCFPNSSDGLLVIMEPPADDTDSVKEIWECVQEYLFQEIPFLLIKFDQDPDWNPFALLLKLSKRCNIWRPCDRDVSAVQIIRSLTRKVNNG